MHLLREVHRAVTALAAVLVLAGAVYGAEEKESQSANAEAPKQAAQHAMFMARMLPPAAAHSLRNRKQQLLRLHHLSVKIPPAPAGTEAAPKPQAESAAAITPTFLPGAASPAVTLVADRALLNSETNGETSTVCEPSVAVRGEEILFTGNWFACFSTNGGGTFSYRSPYNMFPASPQGPFCCDQVANYDKANDLMCWALQYVNDNTGNTLRLAVAKGNDIRTEQWRYYDFTPQNVGNWANQWFDFPDLVLGEKFLYVTSNVFGTTDNAFKQSVVLRLPLQQLAAYQGFSYNYYSDTGFAPRCTHGAKDTMYWAVHRDLATLRVYSWPESATAVSYSDVSVQSWSDAPRTAPGPDGRDWLGREDGRITAAWLSGDTIGFGWSAAQDSNFHFPHVRVAILKKDDKSVSAQPHIWNNNFAFAYPAAAPNVDGRVGVSIHYGGGSVYPSHAIGVFDPGPKQWHLVATAGGRYGPADNKWGDFLTVRPHGGDPKMWAATGFTLQTGPNAGDIEVRYIVFR